MNKDYPMLISVNLHCRLIDLLQRALSHVGGYLLLRTKCIDEISFNSSFKFFLKILAWMDTMKSTQVQKLIFNETERPLAWHSFDYLFNGLMYSNSILTMFKMNFSFSISSRIFIWCCFIWDDVSFLPGSWPGHSGRNW